MGTTESNNLDLSPAASEAWRESGVPLRHRRFADTYTPTEGEWDRKLRSCVAFLPTYPFLVLLGPPGTGKTQMAACILRSLDTQGKTIAYHRLADMFLKLRAAIGAGDGQYEHQLMGRWQTVGGLAIDEAQEPARTEIESRAMTNLIDWRYGEMLPTIIISTMTPDDFKRIANSRTVSRVRECGLIVRCDWAPPRVDTPRPLSFQEPSVKP